jgi:hypothetical protein
MQGLFHPRCAHGVPADELSIARDDLSVEAGRRRPRSLFKAFSLPVTSTCFPVLSSRALRRDHLRMTLARLGAGYPVTQPYGHHRVSITESLVFPLVMSRGHQPS